jgi:hypothetical protein
MNVAIPLALGLVGLAVVASRGGSKSRPTPSPAPVPTPGNHPTIQPALFDGDFERPRGMSAVRDHIALTGAPDEWQDFFALVAAGESGGRIDVGLGIAADAPPWVEMHTGHLGDLEAAAAARAYDRNKGVYAKCWPKGAYSFGSVNWWAMLPANALIAFRNTPLVCLHPWSLTDPRISSIMAVWMGRRLTQWKEWDGTVLSLRVGWGSPESMDDASILAEKREEFEGDARNAGLDPSFLDHKLKRWKPKPAATLFDRLGCDKGWLPQ